MIWGVAVSKPTTSTQVKYAKITIINGHQSTANQTNITSTGSNKIAQINSSSTTTTQQTIIYRNGSMTFQSDGVGVWYIIA